MRRYLSFPKIDLHLHIDGSANPQTVKELALQQGLPLGDKPLQEIAKSMTGMVRIVDGGVDATDYFACFDVALEVMQTPDGLTRITRELIEKLEDQGVIYAELRYAPQLHCKRGMTQEDAVLAALEGVQQAKVTAPFIDINLILCAMAYGDGADYWEANRETVELAGKYREQGVVAVDLAGFETQLPEYTDVFALAHKLGLHTTCHAEDYVHDALPFHTDRIGHGYEVGKSDAVLAQVLKQGTALEMCPKTSTTFGFGINKDNVVKQLFDKGVTVCIGTDNLTVDDTNIDEALGICREIGFTEEELLRLMENAVAASFANDTQKTKLQATIDAYRTQMKGA